MTIGQWIFTLAVTLLFSGGLLASERAEVGETVYDMACASCHDSGALGAPVTGKPADWKGRSSLWEAVLFSHAESGYLVMPAQGGEGGLTEYDLEAAAEYMLQRSNPDMPKD